MVPLSRSASTIGGTLRPAQQCQSTKARLFDVDPTGRICGVTGAASGIGLALVDELFSSGAAHVAMMDLDDEGLRTALAKREQYSSKLSTYQVNVGSEPQMIAALQKIENEIGPIDIFFSNAGISRSGGVDAGDEDWLDSWDVNVMAHIYAARFLVPKMSKRKKGHLVQTASAAGLLSVLGAAPYAVTKHAAVALSEWMAITYRPLGISVSCICPQGVRTPMLFPELKKGTSDFSNTLADTVAQSAVTSAGTVLEPGDVARIAIQGIKDDKFLILPHPEVAGFMVKKASDTETWLSQMIRISEKLSGTLQDPLR